MPIPLEQRIRILENQVCNLLKRKVDNTGLEIIEVMGVAGQTVIFSEELIGTIKVVYVDRNGIPLRIIDPLSEQNPSTRQCKPQPTTGFIILDPDAPIADEGEIFSVVFTHLT